MLPGQAMKNSEDEYDRRTKTILEVRGRENLVLIVGPKLFIEPGTNAFFQLSSVSGPGL
jgi:hypothetical protein